MPASCIARLLRLGCSPRTVVSPFPIELVFPRASDSFCSGRERPPTPSERHLTLILGHQQPRNAGTAFRVLRLEFSKPFATGCKSGPACVAQKSFAAKTTKEKKPPASGGKRRKEKR